MIRNTNRVTIQNIVAKAGKEKKMDGELRTGDASYKTCKDCKNRKLGCRDECPGWQYREKLKAEKYKIREEQFLYAMGTSAKKRYEGTMRFGHGKTQEERELKNTKKQKKV